MSNLSVKRQRANTNGDVGLISRNPNEYREIIATFDEGTLRDLLLTAATNSPQAAAIILARRNFIVKAGNAKTMDDKVQEPEMDLGTVGKKTPAEQTSKTAKVNGRDM